MAFWFLVPEASLHSCAGLLQDTLEYFCEFPLYLLKVAQVGFYYL